MGLWTHRELCITNQTLTVIIIHVVNDCRISYRFLLSIDRRQSIKEAENTIDLAIEYREKFKGLVVGIDLSGDPNVSTDSIKFKILCVHLIL